MAKIKYLIGLLLLIVIFNFVECKGGGGRGGGSRGGGSRGRSSGSHSYGSHSYGSHSSSKPSSSWWSWGSSSSSSSGSSHSYPPSSTGLSGSGNSKPSSSWWPWGGSSSSSSSGSGHSYPSSSTGLSGSGSGKSNYPYSSTGLSGNNYRNPSRTGSGGHYYNQQPYGHSYNVPTYYSMPQHVYVTQYRDSGSSYSDLLTGLTLYNLGRSHSHHHEHYYNDDYYNRRYTSSNYNSNSKSQDTAVCRLIIKDHGSIETLKIPCEIVSTFTDETKKVKSNTVNTTVCVTKTVIVNSTSPSPSVMVGQNTTDSTNSSIKMRSNSTESPEVTMLVQPLKTNATNTTSLKNNTESVLYLESGADDSNMQHAKNNVSLMNTTSASNQATHTQTLVNVVTCTATVNATDPLTVKGPAVDPSGKECIVEIKTKESLFSDKIDCSTLMKYAKMPKPREDESKLMPSRGQLKSWLSNPPWWMSAFIAV